MKINQNFFKILNANISLVNKTNDRENFNCLFCYCPLYMLKGDCGGNFIKNHGIKDCTNCLVPHSKGSYERIMTKIKEVIERGSDF